MHGHMNVKKGNVCITVWRVRVMFIPPPLSISLEQRAFMANSCVRQQKKNTPDLQAKCPIFSPDSNPIWILSIDLQRSPQYKNSRKSVQ
jgi:hypothetical protein